MRADAEETATGFGPLAGYRVGVVHFEVALAELGWLSANGGIVTLGLSARGGIRF